MQIRLATPEEKHMLQIRTGAWHNLQNAVVHVAIENGQIVGMIEAHLTFQIENLEIFPECRNKITRSRASLLLYRATEQWIKNPLVNRTGVRWFFSFTRSKAVKGWAERLGWKRVFKGGSFFAKFL